MISIPKVIETDIITHLKKRETIIGSSCKETNMKISPDEIDKDHVVSCQKLTKDKRFNKILNSSACQEDKSEDDAIRGDIFVADIDILFIIISLYVP